MPLRNIFHKDQEEHANQDVPRQSTEVPQFTFRRVTTDAEEEIVPPVYPGDAPLSPSKEDKKEHRRSRSRSLFGKRPSPSPGAAGDRSSRSIGDLLHIRNRSATLGSTHVPENLPDAPEPGSQTREGHEAAWEKRATLLVKGNSISRSPSPLERGQSYHGVSDAPSDVSIQEAIRLHEAGVYERSTVMFGQLANPNGANNALSQVLYGLALRHGWGCQRDEQKAITYLSMAASNSAEIETEALSAGMTTGGAAKGELILAIYELANCFRNGWGVAKDPAAAKQYYETAANMGDVDAMNEVAWCYLEGVGTRKDKFKAAQYLRQAEEKGASSVGNSWIWKDKYGGPRKV